MECRSIKIIKYIFNSILYVIYPSSPLCIKCNNETLDGISLCGKCIEEIPRASDNFKVKDDLVCNSFSYYSYIMKELVLRFKYKGDFTAGETLGYLLSNYSIDKEKNFDLITFVPMYKKDYKKRGFNQGEVLGKYIGEAKKIEVKPLLVKIKESKDQIGLSGEERWKNLEDTFRMNKKFEALVKNKNILIVDDVITTGATAFYCYKILKNYGANSVQLLTVCKSHI